MSDQSIAHGRRRVLKLAVGGIVAVPLTNLLLRSPVYAADTISPSAPIAKQLGYVEQSPKKGQTCANCKYYGGGAKAGSCQLMGGQDVLAQGWCKSWIAA